MRFSVFTPTYNRGYIIEQLYHSLQNQSFKDFEWIVVDDGSTDNTESIFQKISEENNSFPVRYIKTQNGGKHSAINVGVANAQGELFFIVDSDDRLPLNSLERIDYYEKTIPVSEKCHFAGVCGQRGYFNGGSVGTTIENTQTFDITSLERNENMVSGDKAEVFYTSIMKKFPFPAFQNEKFLTECVVWNRIAYKGYKLRFFNEVVYLCEYLPDGLTANIEKTYLKCPNGWFLYTYQTFCFEKKNKFQHLVDLGRFYHQRKKQLYSLYAFSRTIRENPVVFIFRIILATFAYNVYRIGEKAKKWLRFQR